MTTALPKQPQFRYWLFALTLAGVVGAVGLLNFLVDPLWYGSGNRISGKNFIFNERISKVNRLRNTVATANYDCLILGSSRVIELPASAFTDNRCLNLALKGAELPEILAYGRHAVSQGLQPEVVYIGIDAFNFIRNKETERRSNPQVAGTPNLWHAYFSVDVLLFSLLTMANISPDVHSYYNQNFEIENFPTPAYQPQIYVPSTLYCDMQKIEAYRELRRIFPKAQLVAYSPPTSPWHMLPEVYLRNIMDCELDAFYQLAQMFDAFHDFGIPNEITENNANSVDGIHFLVSANRQVVEQLRGRRTDLALDVKEFASADDYRAEVKRRFRDFLERNDLMQWWKD